MQAKQVAEIFSDFDRAGFRIWAAGGWAVDALVGYETRVHDDLDLAVDAAQLHEIMAFLSDRGFVVTVDWLPVRAELTAQDGRRIDLHPVTFADDGSGRQEGLGDEFFLYDANGFTHGVIARVTIPCLSATQQLAFREGYELREVDRHDIPLVRKMD